MPIKRFRILSLSRGSVPCEFATRLAVDAGLEVIKLELSEGDPLRRRPGHLFSFLAAGKRSIAVDEERLAATLPRIIRQCDAVVSDEWGAALAEPVMGRAVLVVVGARDGTALAGMSP